MNKEVLVSPGINRFASGISVKVDLIKVHAGVVAGDTALHEAAHVIPNVKNVRRASRNPGPGYLGITELYSFDAVAAMGPDSLGHSGTGHDRRITAYHGHDLGTSASVARKMITENWEEWQAIARGIEASGEISGYEAEDIVKRVRNPEVNVSITTANGKERSFVTKTRKADGYIVPLVLSEPLEDRRN